MDNSAKITILEVAEPVDLPVNLFSDFQLINKFEYTKLYSLLLVFLKHSSKPEHKLAKGDSFEGMAKRMISSRDIPFTISRTLPNGKTEIINMATAFINDY
ncbi:hypothetical protein OAG24_00075 [bacterium]|nr:hypothetical protein [bacterium]